MLRTMIACIALAGFVALPVQAAGHKDDERGENHGGKGLNLTQEQKTQLKTLREEQGTAFKELRIKAKALRDQLKVEMLKDKPDQDAMEKQADEAGKLAADFAKLRIDGLLKAKKILSADQFVNMLDREAVWGPGGEGPRGKGGRECPKGMDCKEKGKHSGGEHGDDDRGGDRDDR
jgi:Spy/CpxP family protein refolding chaperone